MRPGPNPLIAARLVERGEALFRAPRVPIRFTGLAAADALLNDIEEQPHAFVIACLMDRQLKAERAWGIPFELSRRLGGFSMAHLQSQTLERIREVFAHPTKLHRYDHMADIAYRGIRRIVEEYRGDAAAIWAGAPPSAEVVLRFLEFDGVGPKIATMAANILARDFKIPFADYYSVDVSADMHVRRVFERLGLVQSKASVDEVVYRARGMHPAFPGIVDLPAWEIGREWCHAKTPDCGACYMVNICPHAAAVGLCDDGGRCDDAADDDTPGI
ncbi:MAG: hypothetical protein IT332_13190 [Ardenticatenales bacterium]|nr:hypothetical protein [Ardenticatenales bacterium]